IRRILPVTGAMTAAVDFGPTGAAAAAPTSAGPVAVPAKLAPLFLAAGARYGVSPTLLAAIARQESGFSPDAVSTSGAEGVMQFMPGTAAGLGITPFTPAQAVDGAARLVSGYIRQFGSVPLALAAYNAGPSAVQEHGGIPPYPQTQEYVAAIMKSLGAAS
ncbi:MAG: lytic transglycosylase domain-containing protein, partial [Acidimicrobiales bacterium]